MRILVYPHSMEIGGSQLNALEIGGALRDRGHEVVVYSEPGPLVDRVHALDLEHLPRRPSRIRPGPATAADLARVARERRLDVLHGYEWPPILEAYAAVSRTGGPPVAVGTIMSMAIAPFLPSSVPLVVGTAQLAEGARRTRRGPVTLLEPPVDTRANAPGVRPADPDLPGLDPDAFRVVVVSRLVKELKLEGILTAIRAHDLLAERRRVQLVVVGGGPAEPQVREAADAVNARHGRPVVVVAGEWPDPRWAYGSADVSLGMGGSALRALAFGTPLVVLGEQGFLELLTPDNVGVFLQQGWYGAADGDEAAAARRMADLLGMLADQPGRRIELGEFGRDLVVARFSLESAAELQEKVYADALGDRVPARRRLLDAARAGGGLVDYKVRRRVDRLRGRLAVDDFNARPG